MHAPLQLAAEGCARNSSGRLARGLRPHLRETADADHLAEIAVDQLHHIIRHRLHGDLDMQDPTGTMRPHAVRHQVAFGEWLEKAGKQAWLDIGVEHEADGNKWPLGGRCIG
jgi:hypothetical protein